MRPSTCLLTPLAALTLAFATPRRASAQDDLRMDGLPGPATATRTCPANAVMTGMRARVGIAIDAVGLRCRSIQASGTLGAEVNYGSLMGGTGGTERIRSCPTGTVVVGQRLGSLPGCNVIRVGLHGRTWNASTRTTSGNSAMVDVVESALTAPFDHNNMCPSAQRPVRRIRARTGLIVDAMGLTCLTP